MNLCESRCPGDRFGRVGPLRASAEIPRIASVLFGASRVELPTWAFVASVLVPWVGIVVTAWLGLSDIRVKAKAEAIEADVKLLRSFAALAPIADAREGAFLSEVVAKRLVERWQGPPQHLDLRPAVAEGPVAAARQAAAVAAIAELTKKHELLKEPGKAMLRGLAHLSNDGTPENVQNAYRAACERVGGRD